MWDILYVGHFNQGLLRDKNQWENTDNEPFFFRFARPAAAKKHFFYPDLSLRHNDDGTELSRQDVDISPCETFGVYTHPKHVYMRMGFPAKFEFKFEFESRFAKERDFDSIRSARIETTISLQVFVIHPI
tara:strand:+ start:832 stop:1221 length:390 start_codon:yes stop_codon:yes gene_type:complete